MTSSFPSFINSWTRWREIPKMAAVSPGVAEGLIVANSFGSERFISVGGVTSFLLFEDPPTFQLFPFPFAVNIPGPYTCLGVMPQIAA